MIKHRLEFPQVDTLEKQERVLTALKKHKGGCDEIWLFLDRNNDLELIKAAMPMAKTFAEKLRKEGIRPSIETCPFGHGEPKSDLSTYSCEEFSVDMDGNVSYGQYCWRSKFFREQKKQVVSLIAKEFQPYAFYFDDDLRIRNWASGLRCFCDTCVKEFNAQNNTNYSQAELSQKVKTEIPFREKYIQFCYEGIADFTYELSKAIAENSPETYMGIEHGHFSGECFVYCAEAMYKATGKAVKSRSGAGSYSDYYPTALTDKTFETQYQLAKLPEFVDERCNEVENFPSTYYSKTVYGTCFEISAHLASGFNCTSVKCWRGGCVKEFELFEECLEEGAKHRTYWEALSACNKAGGKKSGLQIFVPKNYWSSTDEDWMITPPFFGRLYNHYGIPLTFSTPKNEAYYLDEEFVKTITEEELQTLLRAPVATSGAAIEALQQRGFGKYFNVTAEKVPDVCYNEEFTDHAINGEAKGTLWGQSLFIKNIYSLTALDDSTQTLSVLRLHEHTKTNTGKDSDGKIAAAITTTKLGGKWFVQGYRSDDDTYTWLKRQQINDAIRYITGGLLAEHVSRNRLMLFPIENRAGKLLNVSVINPTISPQKNIELIVRNTEKETAYLMNEYGEKSPLETEKTANGTKIFIPEIKSWSIQTVFFN